MPVRGRDPIPLSTTLSVAAVGIVVMLITHGSFTQLTLSAGVGYAVVTVGMVLQLGYTHQLAFSQAMFLGFGGYGVGIAETKYGFNSWEAMLAVVAASAVVSFAVGAVLTRVPGLALPLATLILPLALYELATDSNYLGGLTGINGITPIWSGESFQAGATRTGIVAVLLLAAATGLVLRFIRSGVGLQLMALSTDESLAESMGVNLRQRRMEVFVIGSVLAALGGTILAGVNGDVSPDVLLESTEITLLVMLYIAGARNVIAAILGAIVIQYLQTANATLSANLSTIEGAALVLVFLVEPAGIAGLLKRLWNRLARREALSRLPVGVRATQIGQRLKGPAQ